MEDGTKPAAWVVKLTEWVVTRPKTSILIGLILAFSFAPGLKDFAEQYDVRIWFRESDQNIKILDKFERQFGNDENLVVVVHSPSGIFDLKSLTLLSELTERMWKLPEVIRVDGLTNYNITRAEEDDIFVEPFFDVENFNFTLENLEKLKQKALSHRVLPGYVVSRDGKSSMIFARLATTLEGSPDYENIVRELKKLLKDFEGRGDHVFHFSGEAGVNDAFREVSNADATKILPFMMGLIVFFMLIIFRSPFAIFYPMIVMGLSIIMTTGLCFYIGWKFNSILSVLPGILVAISIADSVHVIASFFQFKGKGISQKEATTLALHKNLIPTLLTSLSTTIGFFSLLTTELMPVRQLGLLAGFGSIFAWIVTILVLCPILVLIPVGTPKHFKQDGHQEFRYARKLTEFILKYKLAIIVTFVSLGVASFFYGMKNEINSNPYLYFKKHIPLRIANDFIQEHFGGNAGPEIIISSGREDGIKDPKFLEKVQAFKYWINDLPFVNKTIDIVDVIKEMNQALNGGHEDQYVIPDTQKQVAEELFLYSMGLPQGMDLNNQMTLKYDALRMTVLWDVNDTRGWLKNVKILEDKAKEFDLNVELTGKFLLFQRMMDYVVLTFFGSVTMAMGLVAILMSILLKSIKLGLFSLIPNILPLIFGAAFMKLAGMQLNIGTALVASVCLGIAVDDTIHFLSNYYRLKKKGLSDEETFVEIFTFTGTALIITTIILVAGFGLYVFGDFIPNVNFGMLCAMVLFTALLVDLVFLPALLFTMSKKER